MTEVSKFGLHGRLALNLGPEGKALKTELGVGG